MTNTNITYRESVLSEIAQKHCLLGREEAALGKVVDLITENLDITESEILAKLSNQDDLAAYAAAVASDLALTHGVGA